MNFNYLHDLTNITNKSEYYKLKLWNLISAFLFENKLFSPMKTNENSYKIHFSEQGFNGFIHFSFKDGKYFLTKGLFFEAKDSKEAVLVIKNSELFNTKNYIYNLNNNIYKRYLIISNIKEIKLINDEDYLKMLAEECIYEISRLYQTFLKIKSKSDNMKKKLF